MLDRVAACAALALWSASGAVAQDWTHLARGADRSAVTDSIVPGTHRATWVASRDDRGRPARFSPEAGVVTLGGLLFATMEVDGSWMACAVDALGGDVVWASPIPPPTFDSQSTPAVDAANGTVIVASGRELRAFDARTGAAVWTAALGLDVVSASPVVTGDLGARDRALVTDADGFGTSGSLYCVNVDPFDADVNPYRPGEVVWRVPLGGTTGNTPAYLDGLVFVSCATDESGASAGVVRAYSVIGDLPPAPEWANYSPDGWGYFGGVCVSSASGRAAVYAASYAFAGDQWSSTLVKLDAATGHRLWSTPCNRTSSIPVVLADGRIALSTGILGFGSLPSVQLFRDEGDRAMLVWDSALESWRDANGNGQLDEGEYMVLGGWSQQPLVSVEGGLTLLVTSEPVTDAFGVPARAMVVADLSRRPGETGFVVERFEGAGTSPTLAGGSVYTVGATGLHAFRRCPADCDGSGRLDIRDFFCFQARFAAGSAYADCDGNGRLDIRDFFCFQGKYADGCR